MAVGAARDQDETRAALARWLAERTGGGEVTVGELTIPGLSGFSNETLIFDASWGGATHGLVIRVEPSGHTVFPSTAFDEQVAVMRALRSEGSVPVPEVLWFEEDPAVLGARFACMARVDGQVPADNPCYHAEGWMAELTPDAQRRIWDNGIDAMAAVHRLDRRAVGLGWIQPVQPAEALEQARAYRRFAAGDVPYPPVDEAFEVLSATQPPDEPDPAVCWGDSRIGNMIFAADQSVAAVLDWEMVTAGDPVQDLAWYLLLDDHHVHAFGVPRLPGLPDRDATVARWEAASGRSAAHLGWYELLGAARYAAIMSRVMVLLDSSGVMPGAAEMAFDHTGSRLLQQLLDERS
jgi:aminoglycoside phosphotransferase (APT) family kinase protein